MYNDNNYPHIQSDIHMFLLTVLLQRKMNDTESILKFNFDKYF